MEKVKYKSALSEQDNDYIRRRGYTDGDIDEEELVTVQAGTMTWAGVSWESKTPGIAFLTRSMSGRVAGIHTASSTIKDYRYFKHNDRPYLPIIYGSQIDFELLYSSREMILVEGVFDRIAMRRFAPGRAVFARLSKGVSQVLVTFIERYADRLWLAFDMDAMGRSAVEKSLKKMERDITVNDIQLPRKDPGEVYEKDGISKGREMINRAMRLAL